MRFMQRAARMGPRMTTRSLEYLFQPKSVALVGASARPGSLGRAVLDNLRGSGFQGRIDLVNPRHAEIDGQACAPSISALPQRPDLVVLCAPREAIPALAEEAARAGAPAAVVITADPDHGPQSLMARLSEIARTTGMRIVGPNCLGLIAPRVGLNASFVAHPVAAGDLAVASQSGAITTALAAWAHKHGVGFSGLVSVGDMADVDFAALLDYFAVDHRTRAILLYIEAVRDAKSFMSAARAAARVKPVIVIKSGRHPRAAKAAATHTGALAGADAVYDAAFRRAGLLRVKDIDELFDAAETLGRLTAFNGKRLAILTNGGGVGVLAVDELVDQGGVLADISPSTMAALDSFLPPTWSHANPVDIVGDADAGRFGKSLSALLAEPANDAVMVMHCPTALSHADEAARAVCAVVTDYRRQAIAAKPVFAVWLGATDQSDDAFESARIPHYETGAMRGFMHLVRWKESREALMAAPPSLPEKFSPKVEKARAIVAQALERGHTWLAPVEIAGLMEAYDIPFAAARMAASPEDAALVAKQIIGQHGACVIKILSRDITHKSDVGGVVLDVKTPEQAAQVMRDMIASVKEMKPQARIDGVTVHPMINKPHARELIAGLAEDPTFGPVIVFGRGGKAVEVINDRAIALPPLDLSLAHDLIERTRVVRILRKYRDEPAADIDAVALTLAKIAQLSADIPQVLELDLNPLLADENGVVAIDARIAVAPASPALSSGANPRFAVAPYPVAWERHFVLRDGTKVFARPVRPDDEDMYRTFFNRVTQEDLRKRFFAPVKDFSHVFIARLTQIDYARAFASAAIDEATGEMLGGVRLMLDAQRQTGEYAILLRSDVKSRGPGWKLMALIIEYAQEIGLKHIEGQVLAENRPMLDMCENLGFSIGSDPDDPAIKLVRLDLARLPEMKARNGGIGPL